MKQELTREELYDCYVIQQMGQREVAQLFGTNTRKVRQALRHYNIPVRRVGAPLEVLKANARSHSLSKEPYTFSQEQLYDYYVNQKMSLRQIGRMLNTSFTTIGRALMQYGIPLRTLAWKPQRGKGGYEANLQSLYKIYSTNAAKRGYAFELPLTQFEGMVCQPCYYCGIAPLQRLGSHFFNGIDRIDNSVGYVTGNVRPCCGRCNVAKRAASEREFIGWILRAADHLRTHVVDREVTQ